MQNKTKRKTKKAKKEIKVQDLKPKKDAKGGYITEPGKLDHP